MKRQATVPEGVNPRQAGAIKTTFMELLETLTQLTQDDALVIAAVKSIFQSHRVRLERSLAPVRLAPSVAPVPNRRGIGTIPSASNQRRGKSNLV